mgnify:CR=1 FL=1
MCYAKNAYKGRQGKNAKTKRNLKMLSDITWS